jgi:hypothetical protein
LIPPLHPWRRRWKLKLALDLLRRKTLSGRSLLQYLAVTPPIAIEA